jgi:hypothetical protein
MRLDAEDERQDEESQAYPSTSAPAVQHPVESDENQEPVTGEPEIEPRDD